MPSLQYTHLFRILNTNHTLPSVCNKYKPRHLLLIQIESNSPLFSHFPYAIATCLTPWQTRPSCTWHRPGLQRHHLLNWVSAWYVFGSLQINLSSSPSSSSSRNNTHHSQQRRLHAYTAGTPVMLPATCDACAQCDDVCSLGDCTPCNDKRRKIVARTSSRNTNSTAYTMCQVSRA